MTAPVVGAFGPVVAVRARHAPDVPVVGAVERHDGPMIAVLPAEPPATVHREGER